MLKTLDPFATITRAETFTELQALGVEKVSAEYGLKDADGWWAAVEHGGVFEASSFSVELEHHYILLLLARGGTVHYPLDPRLKRADVSGAINAFANSANTGWLFSHTNAGPHQDFLLALQAAVTPPLRAVGALRWATTTRTCTRPRAMSTSTSERR